MKAIVIHAAKDLRIEDSAVEAPGPGEVEIRLAAGGICKVAEIADASGR